MRSLLTLLRSEPRARLFFAAHAQSCFGTGAGYVALLLLAYERFPSPWTISAVLLAELLPPMLLGPLAGAAADRWSKKHLLVGAELIRAAAFAGVVVAGSFEAVAAFALLGGVGNAIFNPTVMAALPGMVKRERFAAATSLYGTIEELGFTAGPALAALLLLVVDVDLLLIANAASFAISAGAIASLRFDRQATGELTSERPTLWRAAWQGLRAAAGDIGVRVLLLSSGAVVACLGMINVGELLLAREALGASASQFSLLVAAMGIGVAAGSTLGAAGGQPPLLKRRYLVGIAVCAGGLVASALAPTVAVALPAFAAVGIGNGIALTHERLLLQSIVPDDLLGRVFGVKSSLISWAFGVSFISAGAVAALLGPRAVFMISGIAVLLVWALAASALRRTWVEPASTAAAPLSSPLEPAARAARPDLARL